MIDASTDFYKHVDNYAKFAHVGWRLISGNEDLLSKVFVTISIPTYNRPDTLKDALDSALNQQGYDDFCVMVVDNAPEDGTETERLIRSYNNDKLLYYKNNENTGMFGNQNRCFEIPESDYVVMLHDDDLLLPNFLKSCIEILGNYKNAAWIQPKKVKWQEDHTELADLEIPAPSAGRIRRVYDFENYYSFIPGSQTCGFFQRKAIIDIGGFNSDFYPTADFCLAVQLMHQYPVYVYSVPLAIYRIGHNASTKVETLKLYIYNDFFLKSQIMKRAGFNRFARRYLINNKSYEQESGLRDEFNKDFSFDFSTIGMTHRVPRFIYIVSRIYAIIKVRIKRLFVD